MNVPLRTPCLPQSWAKSSMETVTKKGWRETHPALSRHHEWRQRSRTPSPRWASPRTPFPNLDYRHSSKFPYWLKSVFMCICLLLSKEAGITREQKWRVGRGGEGRFQNPTDLVSNPGFFPRQHLCDGEPVAFHASLILYPCVKQVIPAPCGGRGPALRYKSHVQDLGSQTDELEPATSLL